MNKPYYRTDWLFAGSSFLTGMGSIFGVFAPYYHFGRLSSPSADRRALESDFGVVGRDIEKAMRGYGQ